ncbi:MAG: secretin N-terminal domain-containing protein [Prosthecobacter sp.]
MHRFARHVLLFANLLLVTAQAQIPQQPTANPNTAPKPFNRPGTAQPPRPGGAPPNPATVRNALGNTAGDPAAKPAMKPEDAIKEDGGVELQFPNTPLSQILLVYEDLTGLKIIRDANAEQATVSIETTGELPKEKAIMFIEKSLLLNGYSFVPSGEGMVKLLAFDAKKPQTEGAPLIESAMELPITDQVVSFVVLLKYLSGEDAIKAIDQVIPRHSYGVLTAVPNAKALVITENSNTIRSILGLLERLDNKPAQTISKTFQLTRSDAEDIKKALDEILGTDDKTTGAGGGRTPSIPQNQPGSVPVPIQQPIPVNPTATAGSSGVAAEAIPPKIVAIARRNCLLVIATQESLDYIGKLIEELDAASEIRNFASRPLIYLGVESAMSIISDAISRTEGDGEGGGGASGGTNANGQNQNQTNNQNNQNRNGSSLFGNNNGNSNGLGSSSGFGGSSGGLGGGSGGFGGGGSNLTPLRQNNGPTSMVVGKTLLISDPVANTIFASGPPEHLRILNEILDELDHRPQQILISAVIGDYQIGDSSGFGIETLIRSRETARGATATRGLAGQLGTSTGTPLDPRTALTTAAVAGAGTGLTFYGGIRDGLDVIVQALNTNTDFKVISRPSVFTMNNSPATISSGQSFPIASSTQGLVGGGTSSGLLSNVQYQDVVLSLNIIPLINSNDELTLQISQTNSEQSGTTTISENPYPILTKQELNTTVMCKNNGTVLLGGLIREDKTNRKSNVPFLSSIPLLKYLTGSRSDVNNRRELVIMIQPRIIEGINDLPPNAQDSVGSSVFADETRATFSQEKKRTSDGLLPAQKVRASTRVKDMLKKLFQ